MNELVRIGEQPPDVVAATSGETALTTPFTSASLILSV